MSVQKFDNRADAINSLLCVGLDSKYESLPESFKRAAHPQFEFNKHIVAQTHEFAAAYKLNTAFYEARGSDGYAELKMTLDFLRREHPDIMTICDCKRGDTKNTNEAYAQSYFDWFGFDAVTLNPYMGSEPLEPFLKRSDKISMILCRTSNPGAREIQDLITDGKPLWHHVAEKVVSEWNGNGNCMLVVGATYPEEMKELRNIAGDMTFLVPGVGVQQGDIEAVMRSGLNGKSASTSLSASKGLIINASRSVIFAENPREEAKRFRDSINRFRNGNVV